MSNQPLVSICCLTYNHAKFIRQCLDGFLMQQTSFPIEILIHDDCSTDGTTEIIQEYTAKYPNLIFPLYETENQYTIPNRPPIDFFNYRRAKGKYIAYCEGDDYWTDPLKLQKQVDFMESNQDYSICFTRNDEHDWYNNTFNPYTPTSDSPYEEITAKDFLQNRLKACTLTIIFRLSSFDFEWSKHYTCYVDTMEIYHLLKSGKGAVLNFVSGVYNRHQGGVSSSNTAIPNSYENFRDYWEMYRYHRDSTTKEQYKRNISWRLDVCSANSMSQEYRNTYKQVFLQSPLIATSVLFTRLKRRLKHILSH